MTLGQPEAHHESEASTIQEVPMQRKLVGGALTLAATLFIALPAGADAPEKTISDMTGVPVFCGDQGLTFSGGSLVGRLQEHTRQDGSVRVVWTEHLEDASVTDGDNTWLVSGASSYNVVFRNGEPISGRNILNATITGKGPARTINLRNRLVDGEIVHASTGDCEV